MFNSKNCQLGLEMLRPDISRLNVNQMFVHFPYKAFKKLPDLVLCFAVRGNLTLYFSSVEGKKTERPGGGGEEERTGKAPE